MAHRKIDRRKVDLDRKIKELLFRTGPAPAEASFPLPHFEYTIADIWNMRDYAENSFRRSGHYQAVANRHLIHLNAMVLLHLVEAFERFLKEMAAACVDFLARFVMDNRFDRFNVKGSALAAHFGAATLGKSLCEADIWLDCDQVNERFRALLAKPYSSGNFYVFPKRGQGPEQEQARYETMSVLWQIRHTMVHNVGLITQSDAIKLRLLAKQRRRRESCLAAESRRPALRQSILAGNSGCDQRARGQAIGRAPDGDSFCQPGFVRSPRIRR